MAYSLEVSERADRIFRKLVKKDRAAMLAIDSKIVQILENPRHFKPLRSDMHGARRVHVSSSFVLIYEIDERHRLVRILDYGHHDEIYG
jgi:mRNA interferase RelE/StbE/toxin YoeB